jgi:signal transduction histidine kinase
VKEAAIAARSSRLTGWSFALLTLLVLPTLVSPRVQAQATATPLAPAVEALLLPLLTNDLPAERVLQIALDARAALERGDSMGASASLINSLECRAQYRLARIDAAVAACQQALSSATTDAEQFAAQRLQGTLLTEQARFAEGATALLASLRAAERIADPRLIAAALNTLGSAAQFAGAYTEAIDYYQRGIELALAGNLESLQVMIRSNLGYLLLESGDPEGARVQFEAGLEAARDVQDQQSLVTVPWGLASAKLAAGDAAGALARMRELARIDSPATDPVQRSEALQMLARARLATGDATGAVTDARSAVAALQGRAQARELTASVLLVEALTAAGQVEEALALAKRTLARMPAGARLSADLHAAHARALALIGRHREAYDALQLSQRVRQQQTTARASTQLAFLRARSEAQQRERELERLRIDTAQRETEARNDRTVRNLSIAVVLVTLVAVVVIAVLARRRQQLMLQIAERHNLDALGKLTGGVAHDFNNLMTIIRQAMSLLRREPAVVASPTASALVDDADSASEVCGRITTQLLTYARQQRMESIDIRVANLLEDHRALFQRALGADIRLNMGARDPACVIRTDSSQLVAAIMNLLANARDALPGGGLVDIEVRRRDNPGRETRLAELPAGRYVAITVRDNGPGMSAEVLRQATTPFFTTKSETGGTGLGLSTVEGFTRQSGGMLLLQSAPDRGTDATMLFPAVTD